MGVKLSQIIPNKGYLIYGKADIEIKGIAYDSRKIKKGYLFIPFGGQHLNGNSFIDNAIDAGAAAVVTNEYRKISGATLIVVNDPIIALAEFSSNFYGHPDKKLFLIGITGTNGKTTISYMLEEIFKTAGKSAGVTGTINYRFAGKRLPAPNTTPQSADVYQMLAAMVKARTEAAIMEVSSHALTLGRVEGMEFDIGIFTNLTRDHLDFHKNMDEYFLAKSRLFAKLEGKKNKNYKAAVINIDDPWGKKLISLVKNAKVITYGFVGHADVTAKNIKMSHSGTEFYLVTPFGKKNIKLSFLGQHNIYNALAAIAASLSCGIKLDTVVKGLEKLKSVPGRLEIVKSKAHFTTVVDYAHTDDALKNVLNALINLRPKRIITVFGCGGERDRTKRPLMGETAVNLSDYVFITSDNPRGEDPLKIVKDIEDGIRKTQKSNYCVILEREQAISSAINMAIKGDIVLIAGKGHETYQIIGDKKIHFNDVEVAEKYLGKKQK